MVLISIEKSKFVFAREKVISKPNNKQNNNDLFKNFEISLNVN